MTKNAHKAMVMTMACAMSAGLGLSAPESVPYDDNPDRSKGAKNFKRRKNRRKTANSSRRMNRRKQ
ncbi:MAG: hypothetical protein HDT42_06205 [Ruminococcaceae bacterium]|nr:hypothetical protein [Oscillospiraceae bacterium]